MNIEESDETKSSPLEETKESSYLTETSLNQTESFLDPMERLSVKDYKKKLHNRSLPLYVSRDEKGELSLDKAFQKEHADLEAATFRETFGTVSIELQKYLMEQLERVVDFAKNNPEKKINACLALLHEMFPKDSTESMLSIQMIGYQESIVPIMGKLSSMDNIELIGSVVKVLNQLTQGFRETVKALTKHQNKENRQRICVEHVHLNDTSKAIFGNVDGGGK